MSDYSENNRTNYNEIHEEGLEKDKTAIKAAKDVKRANRRAKRKKAANILVCSFAVLVIAVPNMSAEAADAMSDIAYRENMRCCDVQRLSLQQREISGGRYSARNHRFPGGLLRCGHTEKAECRECEPQN